MDLSSVNCSHCSLHIESWRQWVYCNCLERGALLLIQKSYGSPTPMSDLCKVDSQSMRWIVVARAAMSDLGWISPLIPWLKSVLTLVLESLVLGNPLGERGTFAYLVLDSTKLENQAFGRWGKPKRFDRRSGHLGQVSLSFPWHALLVGGPLSSGQNPGCEKDTHFGTTSDDLGVCNWIVR
jgi:hypothetical protein